MFISRGPTEVPSNPYHSVILCDSVFTRQWCTVVRAMLRTKAAQTLMIP